MGTLVHIGSLATSFLLGLNFGGTSLIAEPLSLIVLGIALVGLGVAVRRITLGLSVRKKLDRKAV